mgnify:CR=1 FL=1
MLTSPMNREVTCSHCQAKYHCKSQCPRLYLEKKLAMQTHVPQVKGGEQEGERVDEVQHLERKRDIVKGKVADTQEALDHARAARKTAPKGKATEAAQLYGQLEARLDGEKQLLVQVEAELEKARGAAPQKGGTH